MTGETSARPHHEHRVHPRTTRENTATGLIQRLVHHPQETAAQLESEARAGADPAGVLALLDAAEQLGRLRGLTLGPLVGAIRRRIERHVSS